MTRAAKFPGSVGVNWPAVFEFAGLPRPLPEFVFHAKRKWRFDFAWPEPKLALEVEGGAWTRGRHTRGKGFVNDLEKYNAAILLGWRVLRCTPQDMESGAAMAMVEKALR